MTATGHPPPPFVEPLTGLHHYAAWSVDPPARAPFVRRSRRRADFLDRLRPAVRELAAVDGVHDVRVLRAVLMPPLPGVPRYDVVLLARTADDDAAARLRASAAWSGPGADRTMELRNVRRIGETGSGVGPGSTLLLNHFTAPDAGTAIGVWEEAAAWFLAVMGVDNSTLLQPDGDEEFAIVNYARLPTGPLRFLLGQLLRPGFHRHIRPMLARNRMTALPVLFRPVA